MMTKLHFYISPVHLMRVSCSKVEGDEGQPDDAGRVHREPDELRLVEVLGHLPGLDGEDRADGDEDHAVDLESYQKLSEFSRNKYCTTLYICWENMIWKSILHE